MRRKFRFLSGLFTPQRIAVVGASDRLNSLGHRLMENIAARQWGGDLYAVNPAHRQVMGHVCYESLEALPEPADLAVIATPAAAIPEVIIQARKTGVKTAIIMSSGFKEPGGACIDFTELLKEQLESWGGLRIFGPNSLGFALPHRGLFPLATSMLPEPGHVAFISQSAALCHAVLDWSHERRVGFSAFFSTGTMFDIDWADLLWHLAEDRTTRSIVLYIEQLGDPRSFISAAREVAYHKPVIALKANANLACEIGSLTHTARLAGPGELDSAVLRRCGVLEVSRLSELFELTDVLGSQPRANGPRLAIITNANGPALLASSALAGGKGKLAVLSAETIDKLDKALGAPWQSEGVVNLSCVIAPAAYRSAVEVLRQAPEVDGILAILTPHVQAEPVRTAKAIADAHEGSLKPLLACWMGGREIIAGRELLRRRGVPEFEYPDTAVRMFNHLWRYGDNMRALYETPSRSEKSHEAGGANDKIEKIFSTVREQGRALLSEAETKELLTHYHISAIKTVIAKDVTDAVEQADAMGYPVVIKLHSHTLTHKSEVGGVVLNVPDADGVREACKQIRRKLRESVGEQHCQGFSVQPMVLRGGRELLLGAYDDPRMGPVVAFGAGGSLAEEAGDHAFGLPPLNATLARRLIERTRVSAVLNAMAERGALDMAELEGVLVNFSQLVAERRELVEIELNPLLAGVDGHLLALDARAVLRTDVDQTPTPLAIRPYPRQYVSGFKLKDGTELLLRPIRPEDEQLIREFHETLSEDSVRQRYFQTFKLEQRIDHQRLCRICFIDYDREVALVVERREGDAREILAVGRLSRLLEDSGVGEYAIIVSDQWQRQGLGRELLSRLIQIGREEGLYKIIAHILPDNLGMRRTGEKLGFTHTSLGDGEEYLAELML